MRTVDVSIGHDDDVVVPQLVDVVFLAADAATQRGDQRADFLGREHLVEACLLDVEDLALEREDRLGLAVAALLGRATRGVTLHDVQFGQRRILLLTVGKLARQAGDIQRAFAPGHFPCLARSLTGAGSVDHLADYRLRLVWMLQQEVGEVLAHLLFHRGLHLGGNQLVLGLGTELRIRHLDRDDRGQTFTCVITGGGDLVLLRQAFLLDVVVQVTRQCGAEAGQVSAAVTLGNVVGKAEDVLVEAVVPLQRDFDADAIVTLDVEVEHLIHRGLVGVQVGDEGAEAAFVLEQFFLGRALVAQDDTHPGVEKGQFAKTLGQNVPAEMDVLEGLGGWFEMDLRARRIGLAHGRERGLRDAMAIELFPHLAFATDGQQQLLGQCIHHRDTHAVQATGYLVGVVVELTACVQHGHDDLGCRYAFFVNIHRNAAAVVAHGDGFIGMDGDGNIAAVAGQRFIDRVIDDFEDHVVQAGAVIGVADIHARALTHGIKTFQYLDARRVVRVVLTHAFTPEGPWSWVICPCST